jgi:histone-lysine N-methyltransferase SETMAR
MLNKIVTEDESWVHHYYKPESMHASIQWKHSSSSSTKKFKFMSTPSAEIVMLTVFWDSHIQKRGENVNSASYECCEVLLKLRDVFRGKLPGQLTRGVLLHHDNARPHTARAAQERIQELQWELLEHLPYSADLAQVTFIYLVR